MVKILTGNLMKPSILHVIPNSLGGVHTILQEIIRGTLCKYDISVLVVGESSDFDEQIQKNIHLIKLRKNIYGLSFLPQLISLIRKADIVHVHLFPALYYCAIFKHFFPKKKFVYTEHASMNHRRLHKLLRYIEIPIYKSYDSVVAVSDSCKRNLCTWLMNKVEVCTINNGININRYQSHSVFDFFEVGIQSQCVMTMVARLSPDKDFETLFNAMSLLNDDYHLVLLGEGELRQQLEEKIGEKSLSRKITLLGFRCDVADILAASTLSILSSYAEGMPMVILESLVVHTPCIASCVDGIKDILPPSYMFEQGNSKALADLVVKVVNNEIEPLPYERILNAFSVQSMVDAYIELYENRE